MYIIPSVAHSAMPLHPPRPRPSSPVSHYLVAHRPFLRHPRLVFNPFRVSRSVHFASLPHAFHALWQHTCNPNFFSATHFSHPQSMRYCEAHTHFTAPRQRPHRTLPAHQFGINTVAFILPNPHGLPLTAPHLSI